MSVEVELLNPFRFETRPPEFRFVLELIVLFKMCWICRAFGLSCEHKSKARLTKWHTRALISAFAVPVARAGPVERFKDQQSTRGKATETALEQSVPSFGPWR